jgi:hypothetical protein
MADKTIAQLDVITLADVLEAALLEIQNVGGTDPASRKVTLPQLRLLVDDVSALTAATAAQLAATTYFTVQDSALADPTTRNVRKVTLAEMRLLILQSKVFVQQTNAKVGTTAGWVVNAANDLGKLATIPAAQTNATLVVPITGLKVGDTITAFSLQGSIQSGGNTGTITADLRKLTAAAAGATDASVGSMAAPLSVTANTVLSSANAGKTGLAEVVAEGESFYVLITCTTGAVVTAELQSVNVTVTQA